MPEEQAELSQAEIQVTVVLGPGENGETVTTVHGSLNYLLTASILSIGLRVIHDKMMSLEQEGKPLGQESSIILPFGQGGTI